MGDSNNLVLFFEYLGHEHIGKDPFLVPYYLGKELGCSVSIVYPMRDDNADLPKIINGVSLIPIRLSGNEKSNNRIRYSGFLDYLWSNAREIDYVMKFFANDLSLEMALLYKLKNPKGKFYIKMDVNPMEILESQTTFVKYNVIKRYVKIFVQYLSRKCVDVISCETNLAYNKLVSSVDFSSKWGNKLVMMPNGFDESLFEGYKIEEKVFKSKKNVMISVGRLGTPPKNTPMLLKALENIDLKDWIFYLIGPVDEGFSNVVKSFYIKCPNKINNVIFTGPIYDKKQLWEYYNRSKVFVLTSEWESYGLVLVEAKRFRNYIVTTPVGAAYDLTENGLYGEIVPNNDSDALASILQSIVNDAKDIDVYNDFECKSVSYERMVKIVAKRLKK